MSLSKKYFTTREWGFGSNIVNFLKSAFFCDKKGYNLILQDRNNSIGNDYSLFSVIELPLFINRSDTQAIIPIENFKTLAKFNLYGQYSWMDKLKYSFFYMANVKKALFLNNFNADAEINDFFLQNYEGSNMLAYWRYGPELKCIFEKYDDDFGYKNYVPDISLQIRGGDKIAEAFDHGVKSAVVDDYLRACSFEIEQLNKPAIEIYLMTDTYSYFVYFRNLIKIKYPHVFVRSLADPKQEGYQQGDFNNLDKQIKINAFHFFLYEMEMLRKSPICIGSFGSNIFYLASLIKYNPEYKFLSVDLSLESSFL